MQDHGTMTALAPVPGSVREQLATLLDSVQLTLTNDSASPRDGLEEVFYRLESVIEDIDADETDQAA